MVSKDASRAETTGEQGEGLAFIHVDELAFVTPWVLAKSHVLRTSLVVK
jgi:hypothetical protein